MIRRLVPGILLPVLLSAPWAEAGDKTGKIKPAAPPSRANVEKRDTGATIPPATVEKQVAKLTDKITWHASLDDAKTLAQKQNKPIFWLHALGDLDGIC